MSESTAIVDTEKSETKLVSPQNRQIIAGSIFDIDPKDFKTALDRRKQNRDSLIDWLNEALTEGIDYGRVHINKNCKDPGCMYRAPEEGEYNKTKVNPAHWSRLPSLFKPGAEKIQGYLGLIPFYPMLEKYEEAFFGGVDVKTITLQCQLINTKGEIIAYGIGARELSQNQGIVNNALKMAKKSGLIDAVLGIGGLSEIYTQDLEDMTPGQLGNGNGSGASTEKAPEFDREYLMTFGKWGPKGENTLDKYKETGTPLNMVPEGSLKWYSENPLDRYPFLMEFAKKELHARKLYGHRIEGDPLTDETKKLIQDALDEFEKDIPAKLFANIKDWLDNGATEPEGQKTIDTLGKYCKIKTKPTDTPKTSKKAEKPEDTKDSTKDSKPEKSREVVTSRVSLEEAMEVAEVISLLKDHICRDYDIDVSTAIEFLNVKAKKMFAVRTLGEIKIKNAETLVSCYNAGTLKYEKVL